MEIQAIENELSLLRKQGELLNNNLKYMSNCVNRVEATLTDIALQIPFVCKVNDDVTFKWYRHHTENFFRLYLKYTEKTDDGAFVTHDDPIIEMPLRIRLAIFKHLPYFINEFTLFLDEFNKKIEIVIKETNL